MNNIQFYSGKNIPLEMHKARIVQKISLLPVEKRLKALQEAGNNLYMLQNSDIFLDMLTDSGVNAMSDNQLAGMMNADDAYAGSRTFYELKEKLAEIFGMDYFLPTHQGRACENIIAGSLVKEGDICPMNYHFTTTKAHIVKNGGRVVEVVKKSSIITDSKDPFKGDFDLEELERVIKEAGPEHIPFVRVEAGTNLIGGQPISLGNIEKIHKICNGYGITMLLDASLLQDNLYFMKVREDKCKNMSIREITKEVASHFDIIYFSARKLGFARGGGILVRDKKLWDTMKEAITLYEGFLTYGGMSIKEMGAITVGLDETMDFDVISQGPLFIEYMVNELDKRGIPVVKPAGGLGCHIDAMKFIPNVPGEQYPAAALSSALYIAGGIRSMERGTLSEDRNPDGSEHLASMELVRCAMPRRVFTLSQVEYAIDRTTWLWDNRDLIGGLRFTEEPKTLRFFVGRLEAITDWQEKLADKFRKDFPNSL
ncbi:tryptophanase [Anaerocolumna sp.]|uniref:tryptophanase n=1 Tax=Anaerocolumna sp. TaxID=2041569 RepID=UPI0028A63340|nr:tryptophanase [Anaerocolumna sp.]